MLFLYIHALRSASVCACVLLIFAFSHAPTECVWLGWFVWVCVRFMIVHHKQNRITTQNTWLCVRRYMSPIWIWMCAQPTHEKQKHYINIYSPSCSIYYVIPHSSRAPGKYALNICILFIQCVCCVLALIWRRRDDTTALHTFQFNWQKRGVRVHSFLKTPPVLPCLSVYVVCMVCGGFSCHHVCACCAACLAQICVVYLGAKFARQLSSSAHKKKRHTRHRKVVSRSVVCLKTTLLFRCCAKSNPEIGVQNDTRNIFANSL